MMRSGSRWGAVIGVAVAADKALVQREVGRTASIELPAHLVDEYNARDSGVQMALQP